MSGIYGFVQTAAATVEAGLAMKRMQRWNRAYGRDREEVYAEEGFGVGCACEKLSADRTESSPVLRENGMYAVLDALLYNREELEKKCGTEKKLSDEELLLSYIGCCGADALCGVNGDFAGAVYDEQEGSLLLFRDHMGVRPLYYFVSETAVFFSTDLRGLLAVEQVDAALNEEWIYKNVGGFITVNSENTEFAHIFCVPPGGYLKLLGKTCIQITEKKRYWQAGNRKLRFSSEAEYRGKLRELVTDAVKRRLDAVSGMVGAELSGGLDSGVIDILIHRLGRECVYFSWSPSPEEVPYAKEDERLVIADICRQEGITCRFGKRHLDVGMESSIAEGTRLAMPDLNPEEPPAMRYALPPYINALTICEAAQDIRKNGAKVVFTGHGGDEGVSHRCNPYELFYHHEYYHFFRLMWSGAYQKKPRVFYALKNCRKTLKTARKELKEPFRTPFGVPEFLNKEFAKGFSEKKMPVLTFAYDAKKYVADGYSRSRLDNVALLGAYCGVRYLVPYLDYRVIDFAVSIPRHLYMRRDRNRYIFREAFRDIMPESLYSLRGKEDNSKKNMEKNPDWYEEFAKRKEDTVKKLDRAFWEKYLDYEQIDAWLQRGKPSEEECFHEKAILQSLFSCALLQNLAEKAREAGEP